MSNRRFAVLLFALVCYTIAVWCAGEIAGIRWMQELQAGR